MRHRGIENLLLRRVRRHQSMTALFRAPNSDRPPQLMARPIVQKQEQDSLVDTPATEASPSIPVTLPRLNTVARQDAPASTSAHQPLTPIPSTPANSQPLKTPDPAWKRLETIFRKHQEQDEPPAKDMEVSSIEQVPHEEKVSEASQTISAEEPALSAQEPITEIPAAKTIQRSSEDVKPKSEVLSSDVQRKAPLLPSVSSEPAVPATTPSVEDKPALPTKAIEVNGPLSTNQEIEKPSLPLESVWNVQRVEATHPLFHEDLPRPAFDSTDVDENETFTRTPQASEHKLDFEPVQLQRKDDPSIETKISDAGQGEKPRGPVEILSPSRPRPPQVDLPPSRASIQRQSQDSDASPEVREASPVNTAIGPLPADLWWLLGQKPPSTSQPDIQRTIHSDQKQVPSDQSHAVNSQRPTEHPPETTVMPNTIQRQVLSKESLPSDQQGPAGSTYTEKAKPAEPDLDDLVRRVYAEVRRRLAAEWERRR